MKIWRFALVAAALVLSLAPRNRFTGEDGPAKDFVRESVWSLDPAFAAAPFEIRIVTSEEEWADALPGWSKTALGNCEDEGRILIRATPGVFPTEHTVRHEVGHAVWNEILTAAERARIREIFRSGPAFPTKYSRKNPGEFFAEIFAAAAPGLVLEIIERHGRTR